VEGAAEIDAEIADATRHGRDDTARLLTLIRDRGQRIADTNRTVALILHSRGHGIDVQGLDDAVAEQDAALAAAAQPLPMPALTEPDPQPRRRILPRWLTRDTAQAG
jgi:hypothetical protein